MAYLIQQANDKGLFNRDYKLLAAYIDINTGRPCRCYFQIEHNERKLGFSADVEINFNEEQNQIELIFSNAKVGKLPIPKKFIVHELKKTKLDIIASHLSFEDLSVNLPTHFDFAIPNTETTVSVDILNIIIYEDQVHIETNPVLNDALNDFKNSIGDKILDFAQDHLPDELGDYLEQYKKSK